MAAQLVARRSAGSSAGLLAPAVSGGSGGTGAADGSAATGDTEPSWCESVAVPVEGADAGFTGTESWGRCDAIHGVARGVSVGAVALEWSGGCGGGQPDRRAPAPGVRGAGWAFCQYLGVAF